MSLQPGWQNGVTCPRGVSTLSRAIARDKLTCRNHFTGCGNRGVSASLTFRCHSLHFSAPTLKWSPYLFRTKTLLKLSEEVGASWTDEFDPEGRFFGWETTDDSIKKLVAISVIESQREKVVVPAGSFKDCLKVVTKIQPAGGEYDVTIQERVYTGKRTVWFAPGVGIVQIRYINNDECNNILLVDYDVRSDSEEYLPLDVDNRWQYQWASADRMPLRWNTPAMYNEIVRVTAKSDGNSYIACAAYIFELKKQSQKEHHLHLLHTFRQMGDGEGEKFALLDLCGITREDEKEESIKYHEELHKLSVESGDRVYELMMQSELEILRGNDEYKSKLKRDGVLGGRNYLIECTVPPSQTLPLNNEIKNFYNNNPNATTCYNLKKLFPFKRL